MSKFTSMAITLSLEASNFVTLSEIQFCQIIATPDLPRGILKFGMFSLVLWQGKTLLPVDFRQASVFGISITNVPVCICFHFCKVFQENVYLRWHLQYYMSLTLQSCLNRAYHCP